MTTDDAAVLAAGSAAVTYDMWGSILHTIPGVIQVIVTTATVVYVLFRAANEIQKFMSKKQE